MNTAITEKLILRTLLALCISALGLAYISEIIFGYKPCILCLYQRIPYFLIIIISSIGLIYVNKKHLVKVAIILSVITLFINSGIAFYQVGIEQKVFKMTAKCSDDLSQINSLEDLKLAINNKTSARCDEPDFIFLGLSMAAWNMIFTFILAIFTIFLYKRRQT